MLKKVLIANRGEIALRIIRTARRLGIATVAVAAEPDLAAPYARAADEMVPIGPGPATESYLRADKIIEAARRTGADAIHPGYGFLSENADFADAVTKAGMKFIGPSASAMRALGGKSAAKAIAIKAKVPVVPGYQGDGQDPATLADAARQVGYPVMIKAVAGGGGRGMRLVERAKDFDAQLESAQREAESAFGDPRVLIEKLVVAPRHIEVQVFGDSHGNVVHLFERDCSLQRRNQKVIEEAPAPDMSPELRENITAAAVKLAKAVGYEGAGTVEFLIEGGVLAATAPWYFIEMNTRLQVEHPVTEAITGLDLVEWQLRIASGERLPAKQGDIRLNGHAIEARLCAEDPSQGFLPSIGRIARLELPSGDGVRCDFGVESGSSVSPFYDSMIGKIIVHGADRREALARLVAALESTFVAGLATNAAFLRNLLRNPTVSSGKMDTGLIGRELAALTARPDLAAAVAGAVAQMAGGRLPSRSGPAPSPWGATDAFQLGGERRVRLPVVVDGAQQDFDVAWSPGTGRVTATAARSAAITRAGGPVKTHADGSSLYAVAELVHIALGRPVYDINAIEGAAGSAVRAPINGRVAKVFVAQGDTVEKGGRVAVVEAMKMEHVLHAPRAGTVAKVSVREGQQVAQGAIVVALAEEQGG
jgi:3-methylcrotonyl-CoA carboxylase alpha subunit